MSDPNIIPYTNSEHINESLLLTENKAVELHHLSQAKLTSKDEAPSFLTPGISHQLLEAGGTDQKMFASAAVMKDSVVSPLSSVGNFIPSEPGNTVYARNPHTMEQLHQSQNNINNNHNNNVDQVKNSSQEDCNTENNMARYNFESQPALVEPVLQIEEQNSPSIATDVDRPATSPEQKVDQVLTLGEMQIEKSSQDSFLLKQQQSVADLPYTPQLGTLVEKTLNSIEVTDMDGQKQLHFSTEFQESSIAPLNSDQTLPNQDRNYEMLLKEEDDGDEQEYLPLESKRVSQRSSHKSLSPPNLSKAPSDSEISNIQKQNENQLNHSSFHVTAPTDLDLKPYSPPSQMKSSKTPTPAYTGGHTTSENSKRSKIQQSEKGETPKLVTQMPFNKQQAQTQQNFTKQQQPSSFQTSSNLTKQKEKLKVNTRGNETTSDLFGNEFNIMNSLKSPFQNQIKKKIGYKPEGEFSDRALKKLKFYSDFKTHDLTLTEFICNQEGHQFDERLDPDEIEFSAPDFGFNNFMTFEEELDLSQDDVNGWRKLMDCIAVYPKYERLQNYIQFVNNKKVAGFLSKQLQQAEKEHQNTAHSFKKQATFRDSLGLMHQKSLLASPGILKGSEIDQSANAQNNAEHIRKQLEIMRAQQMLKQMANDKGGNVKQNGESVLKQTKNQQRMTDLHNGFKEVKKLYQQENDFLKFMRKKMDRLEMGKSSDDNDDENQQGSPETSRRSPSPNKKLMVVGKTNSYRKHQNKDQLGSPIHQNLQYKSKCQPFTPAGPLAKKLTLAKNKLLRKVGTEESDDFNLSSPRPLPHLHNQSQSKSSSFNYQQTPSVTKKQNTSVDQYCIPQNESLPNLQVLEEIAETQQVNKSSTFKATRPPPEIQKNTLYSTTQTTLQEAGVPICNSVGNQKNSLSTLREKLLQKLDFFFEQISDHNSINFDISEEDLTNALLGQRYLREQRYQRLSPYQDFSVLINSQHLHSEEVAENAKLLLQLVQKLHQPNQTSMSLNFKSSHYSNNHHSRMSQNDFEMSLSATQSAKKLKVAMRNLQKLEECKSDLKRNTSYLPEITHSGHSKPNRYQTQASFVKQRMDDHQHRFLDKMNALDIKSPVNSANRQKRNEMVQFDNTRVIQSHVSLPRQHGIYLREKLKLWLDEAQENNNSPTAGKGSRKNASGLTQRSTQIGGSVQPVNRMSKKRRNNMRDAFSFSYYEPKERYSIAQQQHYQASLPLSGLSIYSDKNSSSNNIAIRQNLDLITSPLTAGEQSRSEMQDKQFFKGVSIEETTQGTQSPTFVGEPNFNQIQS